MNLLSMGRGCQKRRERKRERKEKKEFVFFYQVSHIVVNLIYFKTWDIVYE